MKQNAALPVLIDPLGIKPCIDCPGSKILAFSSRGGRDEAAEEG